MTKAGERRDQQREALVEAAERRMAGAGIGSLKARDLAGEVGIALGAIYNLVADLDELVMRVTSRTLRRLDAALVEALTPPPPPVEALVTLARAYRVFASANLFLWRAMFEHRLSADRLLPDWLVEDQLRLFRHIDAPLAALLPALPADARAVLGRTLFSAVHGVVLLGLEEKLVAVPVEALDAQLETLVRTLCRGMV